MTYAGPSSADWKAWGDSGNADTALQADSTNRHRQRWTPADTPRAKRAAALAAQAATWLRDEEPNASERQSWELMIGRT